MRPGRTIQRLQLVYEENLAERAPDAQRVPCVNLHFDSEVMSSGSTDSLRTDHETASHFTPIARYESVMRSRLITRPEEFAALRSDWNRLWRQSRDRSIFLTQDWFDAAWQWKCREEELYILCCERDGVLVGVLPLTRKRKARNGRARRSLEFLTVPDTQRCDALIANDAPDVAEALAGELVRRRREWDVIRLRYLATDSTCLTTLLSALRENCLTCATTESARNPWIDLEGGWGHFYSTRSRRLKKALNLAVNRLAKLGTVEIDWLAPQTGTQLDVENAVAVLTGISLRSWKSGTGNSLDNPGPQAFIHRLAHRAHERGSLSIWTLKINGAPVAMEFQLVDEGNVFALRSDFDAAFGEASPGSHLSKQMLEQIFAFQFSRYYMGPGENAYKYRWTELSDPVHTVSVYAPTMRGGSLAAWEIALKPVARSWAQRFQHPSGQVVTADDNSNDGKV